MPIDPTLFSLTGNPPNPADRFSLTGPAPSGYDAMRTNVALDYGSPQQGAVPPPPDAAMSGANGMDYYAALASLGAAVAQAITQQRQARTQRQTPMMVGQDAQPQQIDIQGTDYRQFLPQG